MVPVGSEEKVYPVLQIASVVGSLQAEGVALGQALDRVDLSESELNSPATRVSLNQVMQCCRNAVRHATAPDFAFRAGQRFHISTFGMYGFAILSCPNFRETMTFISKYQQLAAPFSDLSFKEERGSAVWTAVPVAQPDVDAALHRFLIELQFSVGTTVFRDVMGSEFAPQAIRVDFDEIARSPPYHELVGCPVTFRQPDNQYLFDARWLDRTPELGNEVTYKAVLALCDNLMEEFQLRVGLVGKVREILLHNLARPSSVDAVARRLQMSTRTLRRRLREENSTFRGIMDDVRMRMAIKYLRDTDLTIDEIASALGFSDATSFQHAFRRWGIGAPSEFRRTVAA